MNQTETASVEVVVDYRELAAQLRAFSLSANEAASRLQHLASTTSSFGDAPKYRIKSLLKKKRTCEWIEWEKA